MKRWIGICLMLLMLAGCAKPSVDAPIAEPTAAIPRMAEDAQWKIRTDAPPAYRQGEDRFAAMEQRLPTPLLSQEKSVRYQVGCEHECKNGENHLVRYNASNGITACLGDLGEGEWAVVSVQTYAGLLLRQKQTRWLWLYAWDGSLYPLYELPQEGEPTVHVFEPMFILQYSRCLYFGSFFSRHVEKLYEIPTQQDGVLHPEPYVIGNDIWPIMVIDGDQTDHATIVSAATGKAYIVEVEQPVGPFIRRDWVSFFEARQRDIEAMGLSFAAMPMEQLIEEPAILR